jgi:hypothetical protein
MATKKPFEIPVGMRRAAGFSSGGEKDTKPACLFLRRYGRQPRMRPVSTGFSAHPRPCVWNTASSNGWQKPLPGQCGHGNRSRL